MISVIIPTYNRGDTIIRSINSVLNQTYSNIEIIVIDDNSNDNTNEIIQQIGDKRLKYIRLSENRGACYARNYGLEVAKGEYIAFQDSDDEWLPNKLEKQLSYLINNDIDVVSCRMKVIDRNKSTIFPQNNKLNKEDIYLENYISTQTILGKKKCFIEEKFDTELPRFQDWDLAIRLINKYRVSIMDEILVNVYIQENSISKSQDKAIKAMDIFLKKHSKTRKYESNYLRLRGLYKMQSKYNYEEDFKRAALIYPFDKRIWFDFILSIFKQKNMHYRFYENRGKFN